MTPTPMAGHRVSRRRLLAGAAGAVTLGAGALGGCARGRDVITVASNSFKARDSVDPTTGRAITGLSSIIPAFTALHPDARVELIDINAPSSNAVIAKTQTLLMSGNVDVIQGATLWPFYEQGLLANLNRYFERDRWSEHYLPSILTPPMERFMDPPWATNPSVHLSAPGDLSAPSLAYDAQLFDDFGVEPLGTIPTMAEILEKAPRLTGRNPRTGQQCYAISYDPRAQAHIMLYYLGRGIDLGKVDRANPAALTLNTPQVRRGIQGMIDIAPYCPPGFEIGQGAENWGTADNTVAISMVVYPANLQKAIDNHLVDRYVVTEGIRDVNEHTFLVTGTEWAISSACPDPDLAWELVKHVSGPAGQRLAFTNSGTLPSWRDADWVDPARQPYAAPFTAAAAAGRNAFFPQFMFTTFRPWIAKTVSLAVNGGHPDIDAGLDDMQRKGEQWVLDSTKPR